MGFRGDIKEQKEFQRRRKEEDVSDRNNDVVGIIGDRRNINKENKGGRDMVIVICGGFITP